MTIHIFLIFRVNQKKYIMKKLLFLLSFFIVGFTGVHAQLEQGNFMLGTDLGSGLASTTSSGLFSMNFGLNDGAGFDLGLSPKAGYFIRDEMVIGAIVNLGFSKSPSSSGNSTETTVYGVQGFGRYYLSPGEVDLGNLVNTGQFFVEANAGIAGVNVTGGPTTNGFAFGFGPGYSYFLNSSVAVEGGLKYNGLLGGGNTNYQHSLGINVGIQIFFPRSTVEEAVDDFD